MYKFILPVVLLLSGFTFAANEEFILQQLCSKGDIPSCEKLTAFYVKTSKWQNAYSLGDALCKRDLMKGCTFAATALIATGNAKEGVSLLQKSCDGFEPFACRSLSRIMKKNKEELSSYIFSKRACYYGLDESCKALKTPKQTYSEKGKEFLKKMFADCEDPKAMSCQGSLAVLQKCSEVLTTNDCLLIPGDLSIFFRAKLIQESAKLVLIDLVSIQKTLKDKRFSYDLKFLMKNKPKNAFKYVFGFSKSCTKKFEKVKDAKSTSLALYKNAYPDMSDRTKKNITAFFMKGKPEDCYDPAFSYEAFAVTNLDPMNPSKLDIWKINNDGNLIQAENGLPSL